MNGSTIDRTGFLARGPRSLLAMSFVSAMSLGPLGCSQPGKGNQISSEMFDFKPVYRGSSSPVGDPSNPLPVENFRTKPLPGGIELSWETRKTYLASSQNIGFRIFRQAQLTLGETKAWDFSGGVTSPDFQREIAVLKAKDVCQKNGVCSYRDMLGGTQFAFYAIMAYRDVETEDKHSPHRSVDVHGFGGSLEEGYRLDYDSDFLDGRLPSQVIGLILPDIDRTPQPNVMGLRASSVPWYMIEGAGIVAEERIYGAPLFPAMSHDYMTMLIPDETYYRGMTLSRGSPDDCAGTPEEYRKFCLDYLIGKPFDFAGVFGQLRRSEGLPFSANTLETSRKFKSRAMSTGRGASGAVYTFVADEARILVRRGFPDYCAEDRGEAAAGERPEGPCGFQWSIGTESPRLRCSKRQDGSEATGDVACTDADMAETLSDASSPSDHSLRFPGAPLVSGPHLYIPDAGNARLLRLSNFEEKLKTCGRLLPVGSTETTAPCVFDMVIGQYGVDASDPARFTRRSCLRGGERGGFDGFTPLPDSDIFRDPTGGSGSGGTACRADTMAVTVDGVPSRRKTRLAADYRDQVRSDISPETGLLAEYTKRMFRSPLAIRQDERGRLYVLDAGTTRAQVPVGDLEATLPTRIMVWRRDPFRIAGCDVSTCSIDADTGECRGTGCYEKQCFGLECNASVMLGQPADLYGFTHDQGASIKHDAYFPIAAFDLATEPDLGGVWAVSGVDGALYRWTKITQSERPKIYGRAKDGDSGVNAYFKDAVYAGITIDQGGGYIFGWDMKRQVGIGWTGIRPAEKEVGGILRK